METQIITQTPLPLNLIDISNKRRAKKQLKKYLKTYPDLLYTLEVFISLRDMTVTKIK